MLVAVAAVLIGHHANDPSLHNGQRALHTRTEARIDGAAHWAHPIACALNDGIQLRVTHKVVFHWTFEPLG